MKKKITIEKIKIRIWAKVVKLLRNTKLYPYLYRSYWHYLFSRKNYSVECANLHYYTARPNPGAGIGHQMANWIAGFWYARIFGLQFAHIPFSNPKWEFFLGFGINEKKVQDLKKIGYKVRKLPLFNEKDKKEVELNKKIIQSYNKNKIIFMAEQDQFYEAQYEIMDELKNKFYSAPARKNDILIYSKENFNIAIHVRRGDIMANLNDPGMAKRYLSNLYFEKVLKQVIQHLTVVKPIHIYLFSQGKPEDFQEFATFPNLHWCLEMSAIESFMHFVYADLLITSKSSFSYKPALLNNNLKLSPIPFWHGYPNCKQWILANSDGTISKEQLDKLSINAKQ